MILWHVHCIKEHGDYEKRFKNLSRKEQLNVLADLSPKQVANAQLQHDSWSTINFTLLPFTKCSVNTVFKDEKMSITHFVVSCTIHWPAQLHTVYG